MPKRKYNPEKVPEINRKIADYRRYKGYTQGRVACDLDYSTNGYQHIETGAVKVTWEFIERIAQYYGFASGLDFLLFDKEKYNL